MTSRELMGGKKASSELPSMIFWQDKGMTCGKRVKSIFPYGHWLNPNTGNMFFLLQMLKKFHLRCTLKFKVPMYGCKWAPGGSAALSPCW